MSESGSRRKFQRIFQFMPPDDEAIGKRNDKCVYGQSQSYEKNVGQLHEKSLKHETFLCV